MNDNNESIEDEKSNLNESQNKIDDIKIKSKRSKKIYSINLIAITIGVIIAITMATLYPKIEEIATVKNTISPFTNYGFTNNLSQCTFVLYTEAEETKQGKNINASDIYLMPKSGNEDIVDYNFLTDNLNHYFSVWKQDWKIDFQNLEYAMLDKDGNILKANNQKNLNQ